MLFRRSNGGFYPEQTVAAYQKTFINQLREHPKIPTRQNNVLRARSSLIRKSCQQQLKISSSVKCSPEKNGVSIQVPKDPKKLNEL